jgi:tRNA pseudouridine32 synthase/23S rRNA pseudouridine746 synthase
MLADRIIFEDGEALVIDKPAGMAVHPGPSTPRSLEDHLHALRLGFHRAPTPVHRLDRDTSGCLLLARNPKALKRFAAEFEAGRVAKTYLAVLDGVPGAADGVIDLALAKVSSREEGWRMVPSARGKPSLTRWQMVAQAQGRALIRFEPATGRTHQLRVHAASGLGIPILGDPVYGRGGGEGTMLHAAALRLDRGPKPPVEARAPLPPAFAALGFGAALESGDGAA